MNFNFPVCFLTTIEKGERILAQELNEVAAIISTLLDGNQKSVLESLEIVIS
jgi:hypothetical protein